MGRNDTEQFLLDEESKFKDEVAAEGELEEHNDLSSSSSPKSPITPNSSRPNSMVVKKAHTIIPAHLIAEAISSLHGLDLRWSSPITPSEMQFVQQYVFAKYPEYNNGLVQQQQQQHSSNSNQNLDLYTLCVNQDSPEPPLHHHHPKHSPKTRELSSSPSFGITTHLDIDNTQLENSRLLDIITKKSSFQGNFTSVPEIQVRNRALQRCGLNEDEYLVIFATTYREAMLMVGESYPFFRGNYYLSVLGVEGDFIREFVAFKDSKVVAAPEAWLDLRIKGSQLSQYFRRKCKQSPKGLFSYPACVDGTRYSMHWISEAHRNSWHVLLDATGLGGGEDRLALALHRPDFVICTVDNTHAQPCKITCLLVRRSSFDNLLGSP